MAHVHFVILAIQLVMADVSRNHSKNILHAIILQSMDALDVNIDTI